MVCFQTKNPNLRKFWMVLQWKMCVNFMDTLKVFCFILWTFGIARSNLVYFSPFFVFSTKKNLATLELSQKK
jgi:hypothetical protein